MMSVYRRLSALSLLDWETVVCGFQNGWMNAADVGEYATDLVMVTDSISIELAELTGAATLVGDDVVELLYRLGGPEEVPQLVRMKRWGLGRLLEIQDSDLDPNSLQQALENCYSEFGYMEEMWPLSRYNFSEEERKGGLKAGDSVQSAEIALLSVIRHLLVELRRPPLGPVEVG